VIVVATEDFEVYHGVVNELRDRGVQFTTVEPDDELPDAASVVITGPDEAFAEREDAGGSRASSEPSVADAPEDAEAQSASSPGSHARQDADEFDTVAADPENPRQAVEAAMALLREEGGRIVVGVDPGTKPGVAVLAGEMVIGAFHVPLEDTVDVVRREVADAENPVVRVGDGARLESARIVDALDDVRVELVDETGTTPYLGTGARGMGDVLAAVNIARLEGEVIESREIEPTDGELQVIKNRSRERSAENRTIDEELARRVATGDLTLDEAIEEHGAR